MGPIASVVGEGSACRGVVVGYARQSTRSARRATLGLNMKRRNLLRAAAVPVLCAAALLAPQGASAQWCGRQAGCDRKPGRRGARRRPARGEGHQRAAACRVAAAAGAAGSALPRGAGAVRIVARRRGPGPGDVRASVLPSAPVAPRRRTAVPAPGHAQHVSDRAAHAWATATHGRAARRSERDLALAARRARGGVRTARAAGRDRRAAARLPRRACSHRPGRPLLPRGGSSCSASPRRPSPPGSIAPASASRTP